MKSMKLLKEAAHILETPGDFNEEERQNTVNDISLFLADQERRSAEDQPGVKVSTDGEHWEYTDNVHVVSRVKENGSEEFKEFSITMNAGNMTLDVRSSIRSESSAGNVSIDYEALSTFGFDTPVNKE